MATEVPTKQEQASTIKSLINKPLVEGEEWSLVDAAWFDKWKTFVDGMSTKHPGPIDNSRLLEKGSEEQRLKKGLTDKVHYILLHKEGWEKLSAWYGNMDGQEPIFRKVERNICDFTAGPFIEVYLTELKLCTFPGMEHVLYVEFSKTNSLEFFVKRSKKLFGIPEAKIEAQMWVVEEGGIDATLVYSILHQERMSQFLDPDRPLRHIYVADLEYHFGTTRKFVIEWKNDGRWPFENAHNNILHNESLLVSNLSELFRNGSFSDVTIKVNEKTFNAHKTILVSRSPVFKAMFAHDLQEQRENVVEIVDFESKVIEEMLHFMYTGQSLKLVAMATDLLAAAEKYDVKDLKSLCVDWMIANTSVQNVSQTLITANLHNAGKLEERSIEFIARNAVAVAKTEGWKTLSENNPLLLKIYLAVMALTSSTSTEHL